jgi:hypothetical protein
MRLTPDYTITATDAELLNLGLSPSTVQNRTVEPERGRSGGTSNSGVAEAVPFPTTRLGALAAQVRAEPPARYLVDRLIIAGDYGVIGAASKFGKSLFVADLAVNVAAGGKFLGRYGCSTPGPVVLFAGEGGRRKFVRRTEAIARHYELDHDSLNVHVRMATPRLMNAEHVRHLEATVAELKPVLTIIDPAYLALGGAQSSKLLDMGEVLRAPQEVCQAHGSALLFAHHWNETGTGTGTARFSGTGFEQWARIMFSGHKQSATTTAEGGERAVLQLEVRGDELSDEVIRYRRTVWVDDLTDPNSAMHYEVEVLNDDEPVDTDEDTAGMKPAARRVLVVLRTAGKWLDARDIGDVLAGEGRPLKRRTILEACQALEKAGLIERDDRFGNAATLYRAHLGAGNAA